MPGETNCYRRLKNDLRASHGLAFRLFNSSDGGYPDWLIVHSCLPIVFAEVKSVKKPTHKVELSPRQCLKFSALIVSRAPCFLIAWCIERAQWAVLDGRAYRGALAWRDIPDKYDILEPQQLTFQRGNVVSLGDFRAPKPAQ